MSTVGGGVNIVTDGLVLYLDAANTKSYPGSGTTWTDVSRGGNNGTLVNGPTFNSGNGGSIVFDGVDDFVGVTNPTVLQSQNLSISVWINPLVAVNTVTDIIDFDHATLTYQGWVIQSEDATTNRYYYLAYYDGSNFQPSGGFGVGKGIQITNNVWQNITYVKNSTSVLGYMNGIQVFNGTSTNSTISYQSNRNLRIGGVISTSPGVGARFFKGNIPQVQVYNKALTAQEVLQNYNATKNRFGL